MPSQAGGDRPLRVLHLITALESGGAEAMLHKLLRATDSDRIASSVVSMIPCGYMGERISELGVGVKSLDMRRGVPSPGALFRFLGLLKEFRPDVLQTWLYHADLLGAASRLFCRRPALAWNIRCSFMELKNYRRLTGLTLSACARLSWVPDAILANSRAAEEYHLGLGYRPDRFLIVPNGFDTDEFSPDPEAGPALRQELGLGAETRLVGLAARFDPMKDHQTFLKAAEIVRRSHPEAHFILCGSGADQDNGKLKDWCKELGISEFVHALGFRSDVPRIQAGLDVAVSSSTGESFSNSIGEAMACGTPCVATDVGDSADIIGHTGRMVSPGIPEDLAAGIVELLEMDRDDFLALGQRARQRIVEKYSMPVVSEAYAKIYQKLAFHRQQE